MQRMTAPDLRVFLDSSSGEPMLPDARLAWLGAHESGWGDPLRLHRVGRLAAQALDRSRACVAAAVGARPDEVVFTPSLAQANHVAIAGLALGRRRVGSGIVTTAVDHSSTLAGAAAYGDHRPVGVDRLGRVDLVRWGETVATPGVALATLQVANHEVGTIQPYAEAIAAAGRAGVPVVLDASAALGRLDLSRSPDWAVLTGWAGAFGGPVGVGFLVVRKGARWRAPYPTDDYQDARWPGQPDVASIHAAAAALDDSLRVGRAVAERQHRLVDRLREGIVVRLSDVDVAGDPIHRAPHLLTFSVLYVDGETLTLELDRAGFAVASGSACGASGEHPSHVLAAMGALTHGNVRIGLTRTTTAQDVAAFLDALVPIVAEIRGRLGAP